VPLIGYYRLVVFERYVKFDGRAARPEFWWYGRAARPEFWWFILGNLIISLVLSALASQSVGFAFLYLLYFIAVFLPYLAVLIRRLHDTGKSGYYAFWMLLPLIGSIVLIVLTVQPGDEGANEYGPVPAGLPS
jgi:uncharacterized membrane protein YhaH (DUF805 family)